MLCGMWFPEIRDTFWGFVFYEIINLLVNYPQRLFIFAVINSVVFNSPPVKGQVFNIVVQLKILQEKWILLKNDW